ncbi:MAG: pyrimidine dimer DNA glycosylase/endonuclease V [Nanoarchaeota archaeon]|nr:pyrimidine dimer DNA glycosylase/endonuclease V [Nanoarchaeota archaeon]MBU0977514.1 pyrimidine dimer DNA glycosylase/endonuclease V [Nanoarchaeota archaeon]
MVRINLINPKKLADQHLVAEYLEVLMLLGYVRKNPSIEAIPKNYCLGRGHVKFFKNKLLYLKNRHNLIKSEMSSRGFATNKSISLKNFKKELKNDWKPKKQDYETIKSRLRFKINKKPNYYRYFREKKSKDFFFNLLN